LGRKSGGALWLKADVGTSTTTEGSGVTAWNDQSGTANHATSQLTAPTYQTLGWNFNPIINFLAGYYLSSTDPITDDMTFFAVYSSTQSTSYGSWWQNPAIIGDEANGTQNDYGLCTTEVNFISKERQETILELKRRMLTMTVFLKLCL
jgi:hypothetical protein